MEYEKDYCLKDKYDEIKYLVNDNNRKDELFK